MLRTTFLAAALFTAPIAALASGSHYAGDYNSRVVVAEPRIAVSIGAPLSGFNLYYQSGGYPYIPAAPVYYRAPIVVRAPYYSAPRVRYYPSHRDWHGERHHYRESYKRHDRSHGHDRGWDD